MEKQEHRDKNKKRDAKGEMADDRLDTLVVL